MNIYLSFILSVLLFFATIWWIISCWRNNVINYIFFKMTTKNTFLKILLLALGIFTLATLLFISFTFYSYQVTKIKKPPMGIKGEVGLRGAKGSNGICKGSCDNNLCYKKIMRVIIETYNSWREIKGVEKLSRYQEINNLYIKSKIKQLCNAKKYKKLLEKDGVDKVDKFIHNLWKKWILMILKYEKGMEFLDSEHLTDSDFDVMITEKDKKYCSFDNMQSDGTPTRGEESPFDEIKKYDIWYWGGSSLLKPKVVNTCDPIKEKGPNPMMPSPVLKMVESNNYKKYLWNNKKKRQRAYYRGYLDYLAKNYWVCVKREWYWFSWRCKRYEKRVRYIPKCKRVLKHEDRDLGTDDVTFYRAKNFVDNNENIKYKDYRPLGDIVLSGNPNSHIKKASDICFPKNPKDDYSCSKPKNNVGNPSEKTILVSGDTKPPVGYKKMYASQRNVGKNIKGEGLSFWRPIPPTGYKCLGDIINTGYHNEKPSTDLIRCVPNKCTRRVNNSTKVWDTESKDFENCKSAWPCSCSMEMVGTGVSKDTDHLNQYGQVNMYKSTDSYNLFRTRNPQYQDDNGKFYELTPPGQNGDSGQKSCFDVPNSDEVQSDDIDNPDEKPKHFKEWIVPKKDDPKYSILNIYNK